MILKNKNKKNTKEIKGKMVFKNSYCPPKNNNK